VGTASEGRTPLKAVPEPDESAIAVVIVAEARTDTERGLIEEWAHTSHPGAQIAYDPDSLVSRLSQTDDPLLVPVRVTWLPRERDGARNVRPADLLLFTNPRRPWSRIQPRIASREPDRVRVLPGEPATAGDLRRRFRTQSGGGGTDAFAAFVRRQATLACERAERAIIGDRYKVPRLVAEQITTSAHFRGEIQKIADRLDRSFDEVMADATLCLGELATVQSPIAIDAFRTAMSPMHSRAWTPTLDAEKLDRLRELNKKHALVFLPSHRAYADPLVIGQAFHEHDFPRNHILGGDNMSFWPIGPLGKRAGVIFIRRSFGDDGIYKLAVRSFFAHLVQKRFNLEWYIEGGRTRTGKLRPPRYGLLNYLVRALEGGAADDVYLVPTSLVYDQIQEIGAMADEQAGAKKKSEGLRWMANYIRAQSRDAGMARIDFDEPFSLREALEQAGEGSAQLEKVAFRICHGINRVTPVTAPSLVTFALLGTRDRALTQDEVAKVIEPLIGYLESRDLGQLVTPLRKPGTLRKALDNLVGNGVATCYGGGKEPVWMVPQDRHAVAAFYRNGALHHFLTRAIVELCAVHIAASKTSTKDRDPLEAAWERALELRDLLKFEFFFPDKDRFRERLIEELERIDPDWRQAIATPRQAAKTLSKSGTLVAHRALRAFLDAQLVVATVLAEKDPRDPIEKGALIKECLGRGQQMLLQGQIHGSESNSQELFNAALQLAANRDVLDPGRDDVKAGRDTFLGEVRSAVNDAIAVGKLEDGLIEEVLA
jgi:glycerol-3-phosphate O-acyltransferase